MSDINRGVSSMWSFCLVSSTGTSAVAAAGAIVAADICAGCLFTCAVGAVDP